MLTCLVNDKNKIKIKVSKDKFFYIQEGDKVMCIKNNHPAVVEYIDLPEHMALETDEKGQRLYDPP